MRRLKLNLPLVVGLVLLLGLLLLLLVPSVVALPHPHYGRLVLWEGKKVVMAPFKPGQYGYLLGSDIVGRDLLSRVIYGARMTLGLAVAINLARALVAVPLGLWTGWYGGRSGRILQAVASGMGAIPGLVVAVVIMRGAMGTVLTEQTRPLVYALVVILIGIPRMAEHLRRRTEEIALLPHIEAAESLGASPWRMIWRHVFPLTLSDLLVMLATEMAWVLLMMAQLAIVGVYPQGSVPVNRWQGDVAYVEWIPEWGQMLGTNRPVFRTFSWIPLYPGLALGLSTMTFYLLGEGLRLRSLKR